MVVAGRLLCLICTAAAAPLSPSWPWSWDALPVWGCGQGSSDFDSADVALLTKYPIMWTQGQLWINNTWFKDPKPGYHNYENCTASDAAKIHAVRPDEPVLAYTGFYGCW